MKLDLTDLYQAQRQLDQHIQTQHGVDYRSTRSKRTLALLVEVGELINETRAFKFWSLKAPSEKPIILDEYADGIHFFLSLGLDVGSNKMVYDIVRPSNDVVAQSLNVYEAIIVLHQDFNITVFEVAFQAYLNMMILLGFDTQDVVEGYFKKLGVNYTRQQTKY
jgi:dimeric dUTPase (all-alpha-NTP-PPase superfamily)